MKESVRRIKVSDLIIVSLFLIGFLLVLTQYFEIDLIPETSIAEVPPQHNIEIEPTT